MLVPVEEEINTVLHKDGLEPVGALADCGGGPIAVAVAAAVD
jgi:hypothetical protein